MMMFAEDGEWCWDDVVMMNDDNYSLFHTHTHKNFSSIFKDDYLLFFFVATCNFTFYIFILL